VSPVPFDPDLIDDTPAVVVELDRLQTNVERAAEVAAAHNIRLRPHAKTHKMLEVARLQLAAGAVGLQVAKLGEAEVVAEALSELAPGWDRPLSVLLEVDTGLGRTGTAPGASAVELAQRIDDLPGLKRAESHPPGHQPRRQCRCGRQRRRRRSLARRRTGPRRRLTDRHGFQRTKIGDPLLS
jgi:D-serine deaminase-like pyridoxal phosphate-dependent protein